CLRPVLVKCVRAAAHLAHRSAPHLLPEKGEELLQLPASLAGGGADDAADDPAECTHDSSLTEAILRRVFRSQQGQGVGQARSLQGFVGEEFWRRGRLHAYQDSRITA